MFSLKGRLAFLFVGLLVVFAATACNPSPATLPPGAYQVDPTFADFYKEFGGVSVLGPAISPLFSRQDTLYQYTMAGLLTYDPHLAALKRFHFAPIASLQWKIQGSTEPPPADANVPYINGHRIWEEVRSFYNRYGSDVIGLPLTGVLANEDKQRYEQYFEGIGIYRNYTDPPGQIHLMAYGDWMCGDKCQYQNADAIPAFPAITPDNSETEKLFLQLADRLGYSFTGAPLDSPKVASDGYSEMVFENVVMYLDTASTNQIKLRPLPAWLGIQTEPPTSATTADWLLFYQIQDGIGYNIPLVFVDYITNHGTMEFSGYPITGYRLLPDGGYSQCFTNLCLEYHPTAPEELRIRPTALGSEYKAKGANTQAQNSPLTNALQITVWEQYSLVPSGQSQRIGIAVTQNNSPLRDVEFFLVVNQPDGITKSYTPNPTGENGQTFIELDPLEAPNGAVVPYQVCIVEMVTPQVCFSESYIIWDSP
jgi:hypothetical protein